MRRRDIMLIHAGAAMKNHKQPFLRGCYFEKVLVKIKQAHYFALGFKRNYIFGGSFS